MDKSYKRIENIDAKIQDVKLSYAGWRTLFLIDEETPATQVSEILSEEPAVVETEISHLLEAGLISEIEATKTEPEPEPETADDFIRETKVVFEEEPVDQESIEEEHIEAEIAEEESVAELIEESEEAEEIQEELEELPVSEETTTELPDEPIDLLEETQDEPVVEEPEVEESIVEDASPATEEDLEINIHDEAESESDMLDVDFGEEKPTDETAVPEEKPAAEPVAETPESVAPAAPAAQGTPSVLVIDDSIVIRKMVEIALENEDLTIQTAVSGKDGLDKIDQLNPSLIILDLMLPDINGIDILKTVKASKKIPVIMLSGKDSPQMVEKAKEAGADAFLPKPFKDDELKEQIKVLLEA